MKYRLITILFVLITQISCKREVKVEEKHPQNIPVIEELQVKNSKINKDSKIDSAKAKIPEILLEDLNDTLFINIKKYSDDFVYELKYATDDNFLKTTVYDCAECFFRVSAAKALIEANKDFIENGYKIKFFDCYRPHDVQKKMWKIMPNRIYVANPAMGSVHNKGGAVDMTLVDLNGNELDMGTPFDYFGREAHHAYQGLDANVLKNRKILKETMEKHGFGSITSEWWHYNHKGTLNNKVANFKWDCK